MLFFSYHYVIQLDSGMYSGHGDCVVNKSMPRNYHDVHSLKKEALTYIYVEHPTVKEESVEIAILNMIDLTPPKIYDSFTGASIIEERDTPPPENDDT